MNLLENPFYILRLSAKDNRKQIIEQAENMSLSIDPDVCNQARADLTNPRRRLAAEVAWFPGTASESAELLIALIQDIAWLGADVIKFEKNVEFKIALIQDASDVVKETNRLSPLSHSNLIAQAIQSLKNPPPDKMAQWIRVLADHVEKIKTDEVLASINADRAVSGFPQVNDVDLIDELLHDRRRYYCQAVKIALDTMPRKEFVESVTKAIEDATDVGKKTAPVLLDDLVDMYKGWMQEDLNKELERIKKLISKVRVDANKSVDDSMLLADINQLIAVVKNWDLLAQPIQVSARSRGSREISSKNLADELRDLGLELFHKHGKIRLAFIITNMLLEVFAELDEFSERVEKDRSDLITILKTVSEAQQKVAEDQGTVAEEQSTNKGKTVFKIIAGIIFFVLILSLLSRCGSRKKAPVASAPAASAPAASAPAASAPATARPDSGQSQNKFGDDRPEQGGRERVLTQSEIRWCLRKKSDLAFQKDDINMMDIDAMSNREIRNFNRKVRNLNRQVNDYNRRCSAFTFHERDMVQAEQETGINRDE